MRTTRLFVIAATLALLTAQCIGAQSMWDLEAVDSIGFGVHPKVNADYNDPDNRVIVEGVAISGSDEILNPSGPVGYSTAYNVFIQDDTTDRGGIQAWAGSWFYGATMWPLVRASDYVDFQAGDRLRITGFLMDAGRGKVVINHRHSNDPDLIFNVQVTGHAGLPDPLFIDAVEDCNYFDQTRAGGGERYQTRFVMLHGVDMVSGNWANGSLNTISDDTGSVGMLLSAMGDFSSTQEPTGKLNVTGIFDQEDTTSPYTSNYRVWVRNSSDVASALNACRQVRSRAVGDNVALVGKVVSRVFGGFFYAQDASQTGGVRVVSDRTVSPGNTVRVQGAVTVVGDENSITARYMNVAGGTVARPLCVNGRALWGESGLDVNGLLVRCVARVAGDLGGGLYSLTGDDGRTIHLKSYGVTVPDSGSYVAVTGVATTSGGTPTLLVSLQQDVQLVQ